MFNNRLEKFQEKMKKNKINYYIILMSDKNLNEYIANDDNIIKYLTNFTGSQATLLISTKEALLYVDGRYFIQAENELKNTNVKIKKIGFDLSLIEYLKKNLKPEDVIGFDGKTMKTSFFLEIKKNLNVKYTLKSFNFKLSSNSFKKTSEVIYLNQSHTNETTDKKIAKIKEHMALNNADYHIIQSLDDICWILNIRGNAILNNPVIYIFLIISKTDLYLFTDSCLDIKDVSILPYDSFYPFLKNIKGKIILDFNKTSYIVFEKLKKQIILNETNYSSYLKSIKNSTEIINQKQVLIEDGACVTSFIYWIKKNVKTKKITEYDAAIKIDSLRKKIKDFYMLSFDTISAYKNNAAMMHYKASENEAKLLEPNGFLLVDSGGQYFRGTTDITRTIALGDLTYEEKYHYTMVLKSLIALSTTKFLQGVKGNALDLIARKEIFNIYMNYNCGTGHGVGYFLNVHEGPNAFRPDNNVEILPNTITTNEPGIYIENKYGIRIENEMLCTIDKENSYGRFLKFETITFCPFEKEAILSNLLTNEEIEFINNYHKDVYNKLKDYLQDEEKNWLKDVTRPLDYR